MGRELTGTGRSYIQPLGGAGARSILMPLNIEQVIGHEIVKTGFCPPFTHARAHTHTTKKNGAPKICHEF